MNSQNSSRRKETHTNKLGETGLKRTNLSALRFILYAMTSTSSQKKDKTFRYADLFSGIGGFAAVFEVLKGEYVYAVDIDEKASEIYKKNWKHSSLGDITADATESTMNVKAHDILAGGFPCQPFSKSGAQKGMEETRGTLYFNILNIIDAHHPTIVLLENVRNLAGPRHTHEMEVIVSTLRERGYRVSERPSIFSPHLLPKHLGGRPQVRERVFITATYNPKGIGSSLDVKPAVLPVPVDNWNPQKWNLSKDLPLDQGPQEPNCKLSESEIHWIDAWDEWVRLYKKLSGANPPGFPIWADEWTPLSKLVIPAGTPKWKAGFLQKNSEMYTKYKKDFDQWAKKWEVFSDKFPPSRRKLEWQAQNADCLWDCVMHFRPSGIRAKKPTYLPALVAITQTSIIGPLKRRLSTREAARLQGFPDGFSFADQADSSTYRQLGNGVNIGVVWHVLKKHVERDRDILVTSATGKRIYELVTKAPDSPDELLGRLFPN
jgi:DNA (cytosine-5)-methyltransferase 1